MDVIDKLEEIEANSVIRYFNTLTKFGYKSYNDVYKLIVLLFIEDLTSSDMSIYINEEDYKHIQNMLYCLFGNSCLIPYPEFISDSSVMPIFNSSSLRIKEDGAIIRITQDNLTRVVS